MVKLIDVLKRECAKFDDRKIQLATSICSDELNHTDELYNQFNSVFQLGGLGGYPHCGVTGMNAFLDHVPDDGVAVLLYGPHIGIGDNGQSGLILRPNQQRETTSCGALQVLLNDHEDDTGLVLESFDSDNIQYNMLKYLTKKYNIEKLNTNVKKFTYDFFDVIHQNILKMVSDSTIKNYNFPLLLIGGIIINKTDGNYLDDVQVNLLND